MKRTTKAVAAGAVALALAGCAASELAPESIHGEYVRDAAARVAAADWSAVRTVEVKLAEYEFAPHDLIFNADQPYRLRLSNVGSRFHNFTAPGFFKSVAIRKVTSATGDRTDPYWLSVGLDAGASRDVEFVPVKAGTFDLECSVITHATRGMIGEIRIVR